MTSRTAVRLVRLYPRCWRTRYGQEFAALLEEYPSSLKTFVNVLWSAGEAHMQAAISHECNEGSIVGSVWSAWMIALVACLILYGMIDDSPLSAAMAQNSIWAASWKLVQAGCVLAISAIVIAGIPLASSIGLYAMRERRRDIYLLIAIPFMSVLALVAWMAAMLILTGGHWAASPWAVAFFRTDWPSDPVRWITGTISAVLILLACFASSASVSILVRGSNLPDLRIAFPGVNVQVNPLSFAAALAPWAAAGIFGMLAGVIAWGYIASRLSATAFRSLSGPLGLSGLSSWILSTIILGFAAALSARAAWRSRALPTAR